MKKILGMLVFVISIILITGCSNNEEVVKTCTSTTNDVANGYKLESKYTVYAKGDIVQKVETVETITSDDEGILEYFEESLEDSYEALKDTYGGYTNEVDNENGKVVSKTTIDYTKMNVEQYVKDNTIMENYVNSDNEFLLEGVISIYEALGATCE